ncbi:Chain length determinant protein [Mucilaginibacter sp. OK268]|uniref:Wzz/FepE/Etk N-terminal domain-containing protein n=1 Tax=Mucilaginibacter sp. OK268 TaxID=1881048 RepID=UPI0008909EF7|nr:Wzz/FepE/Etk N-terminal domain-containing protein [Mucilaginibacter sp. OK268]SDP56920.1 Chain length determinant protein [Mucilaginibacter sp. OK268]
MSKEDQEGSGNNSDEISVNDIAAKVKSIFTYVKSKWINILIVAVIGALLGLGYAILKKPTYDAVCTFVLEESGKGGGLGQYAGLASLAGINIGGSGGGGGIFQGDNIIELYKSRTMIEKALLSEVIINGKRQTLIERYIGFNNLRKRWKEKDLINSISFQGKPETFNRKQDSIVTGLADLFNKKLLFVAKPDKKLSIIKVEVIDRDELFAKEFTNKLVENVNNFYVQTKTKKAYQDVLILQRQADSVKNVLNLSIGSVASAMDAAPNPNPALISLRVPSQRRQIDVQAGTAIYSEIVKNLEISKISLRQEMPLIQVIDRPVLPLPVDKISKVLAIAAGFFAGTFLTIVILVFKELFKAE